MPNRLANSTSPYLLQHAENPVDWYEWSEEAWSKAKVENKPVFLSVGYSSCHWCHVMAHESFEDQQVADTLNKHFINIKLDREERPDIDDIYMTAVQLATGHGGWPMSVFLTPDKEPFFAGTYFPKNSHGQFPGFLTLCGNLAQAWQEEESTIRSKAKEFAEGLAQVLERDVAPVTSRIDTALLDQALQQFHSEFDYENGGFGEKPKFPSHALLQFLPFYAHHRHRLPGHPDSIEALTSDATHMTVLSLQKMASGGIHDHVGGGFHRYSTDENWLLPHFEKMLYDNAQLLIAYSIAANLIEDQEIAHQFTQTAQGIVNWLTREMTSPEGIFYSAQDADSIDPQTNHKEEGAYYVWSTQEIQDLIPQQAQEIIATYNLKPEGNYRDESTHQLIAKNILHTITPIQRPTILDTLLQARQNRPAPQLDNKCICAWNALMISGLAQSNNLDLAINAANVWTSFNPTELPHQITNNQPSGHAFLDDYAYLIDALLDLHQATKDEKWKDKAQSLAHTMIDLFATPRGGFNYTSHHHEELFRRTKPAMDNATPSPNGIAIRVLRRLNHNDEALKHLTNNYGWAQRMPQATGTILLECLHQLLIAKSEELDIAPAFNQDLTAKLEPQNPEVGEDGFAHTTLTIEIPNGYHINSPNPPANWLTPTEITVTGTYGEAGFPEPENHHYTGTQEFPIRLKPRSGTDEYVLTFRYQLCSDSECSIPKDITFVGIVIVR